MLTCSLMCDGDVYGGSHECSSIDRCCVRHWRRGGRFFVSFWVISDICDCERWTLNTHHSRFISHFLYAFFVSMSSSSSSVNQISAPHFIFVANTINATLHSRAFVTSFVLRLYRYAATFLCHFCVQFPNKSETSPQAHTQTGDDGFVNACQIDPKQIDSLTDGRVKFFVFVLTLPISNKKNQEKQKRNFSIFPSS